MGLQQHFIEQIVNVQWGGNYYVIIAASNLDYAVSNSEDVKILATRSEFVSSGPFAEPVSGTLIDSSGNAGDDFVTLFTTSSNPIGLENIYVFVCPKTEDVKINWFDYVFAYSTEGFLDSNGFPFGPFFWIAHTWSGIPNEMKFKIRVDSGLVQASR